MTTKELYREYLHQLRELYNANEAGIITDWVFKSVAGLQRSDLIINPRQTLNSSILELLSHSLAALLNHKPVQYVLGEAWFYRMKLKVNEAVLIPRPETEGLVQLVIDNCQSGNDKLKPGKNVPGSLSKNEQGYGLSMLDIGTGSGCIAIAVKKSLPGIMMHAIDISPGALSVARENAIDHQADIRFSEMDFLDTNNWNDLPAFDVIISNPPYIPFNEKNKLDKNVTAFEPHTALFVPEYPPLIFYEMIAAFGKKHLPGNGKIYVEMHEDFAKETKAVFEESYRVEIKKDIFGKERMLIAANMIRAL